MSGQLDSSTPTTLPATSSASTALATPTKSATTPATILTDDITPRRRRTPKQVRAQVIQHMESLAKQKSRLDQKIAAEDQAVLAKQGRMIFLGAVEEMHPGERDLQVGPVLGMLPNDKRTVVQAWLASLAKQVIPK